MRTAVHDLLMVLMLLLLLVVVVLLVVGAVPGPVHEVPLDDLVV